MFPMEIPRQIRLFGRDFRRHPWDLSLLTLEAMQAVDRRAKYQMKIPDQIQSRI